MLYKILILALLLASQTNAAPWNENLRWSLDLSSRARINRANDLATFGFIGLDEVARPRHLDLATLFDSCRQSQTNPTYFRRSR